MYILRSTPVAQVSGLVGHAAANATRAEGPLFAAEGHQPTLRAVVAAKARKTMDEHAAAQIAAQGLGHEGRRRASLARGEVGREAFAQELVQGPGGRVTGPILVC